MQQHLLFFRVHMPIKVCGVYNEAKYHWWQGNKKYVQQKMACRVVIPRLQVPLKRGFFPSLCALRMGIQKGDVREASA